MKKLIIFCLVSLVFVLFFSYKKSDKDPVYYQTVEPTSNRSFDSVADNLDHLLTQANHQLGLEGQLIIKDFATGQIFKKNYRKEGEDDDNLDKSFILASLSKPLTSIMILQLIDEGKLSLDSSICDLIKTPCSSDAKSITVEELLNHRAGLERDGGGKYMNLLRMYIEKDPKNRELDSLNSLDVKAKHHEYSYSNLGYRLLSYLLEKTDGRAFFEIVKMRLAQKYEMNETKLLDETMPLIDQGLDSYLIVGPGVAPPKPDSLVSV